MNTSTMHCSNSKTYLKIEGVTGLKPDIILMGDCRLSRGEEKISLLFNMTQNGGYKTFFNSTKESRGVGIAIKSDVDFELLETFKDEETENYLILKLKIRGQELGVGTIYGPNYNDIEFFRKVKNICNGLNCDFLIGGDFNTILDQNNNSLDRIGEGRIPNKRNGQEIINWIGEGLIIEPFRFFYPEEREVSYIPFRNRRTINNIQVDYEYSQTRLDFYLVSTNFIDAVSKIYYEHRLGRDFDHKPVMLEIGKKTGNPTMGIRHGTLEESTALIEGKIGIYEIVCAHLSLEDQDIANTIGRLEILCREKRLASIGEGVRTIEEIEGEINNCLINLPNTMELMARGFTCDKRTLYEVTMMGLKNRLLNLQIISNRNKRIERDRLVESVHKCKMEGGIDSIEYKISVDRLLTYEDNRLKQRAGKYREFFEKNTEKGTKAFCRLGKNYTKGDNLDRVKRPNGEKFRTDKERVEHIRDFWSKIYKKRLDRLIRIEDFLNNGIQGLDWAEGKRLTHDEKDSLEGPVSTEELENSLKMSNMNSACGWDGISYRVISKFWPDIGPIMTDMVNESFAMGLMTKSFRTGVLKLLPKKTDSSKVENWRPITLLSCGYKVLSGMVANRMETYLPKIIGRAQKGFLRHKNINTVTVNIIDNIAKSINSGEELGVMCIDFIKAFDSVEHACMESTLRFFNFGENFIGMVMTILRGRETMIKLEIGYADSFPVTRGTPQGDRTSPYLFILVVELLLMKLEHARGGGLITCDYMQEYENTMGGENCVCECYADDLTILFKYSSEGLTTIMEIMTNFELTTGLGMNKAKTSLMITNIDRYQQVGETHGITLVDEVVVLGILIDKKLEKINKNWEKAIIRTQQMISYWSNFRLSITGRIMVSKTYLLPQSIYYMNTLPMGEDVGNELNNKIIDYIRGTDRKLSKDRWFVPKEKGGYGMIDCKKIDIAIKCNWIKRWQKEINTPDLPLVIATKNQPWNIEKFFLTITERDNNPCLTGILSAWKIFLQKFYKYGNNWKEAKCWGNIALGGDLPFGQYELTIINRYNEIANRFDQMKVKDLLEGNQVKTKENLEILIGNLTYLEYNRIRTKLNKLGRNTVGNDSVNIYGNVQELLDSIKKGCRKFRDYIDGKKSGVKTINVLNIPSILTLWGVVDMEKTELVETNLGLWGIGGLLPDFKEFIFKFLHGRLYLNSARVHFDDDVSSKCTFCEIIKKKQLSDRNLTILNRVWVEEYRVLERETVWHLFRDCTIVNVLIRNFFNSKFNLMDINETYELGKLGVSYEQTILRAIIVHWVKFYIYKKRCSRSIPTSGDMNYEYDMFMEKLTCIRSLRPFIRVQRQLFNT